jgi:hypothetical protein
MTIRGPVLMFPIEGQEPQISPHRAECFSGIGT